jgi:glutaredoxin 3
MQKVKMYSTDWCPYCVRAEQLLTRKGVRNIEKINVDVLPEEREHMMSLTGRRTVPQIFIGDSHVGGFDELTRLDRAGTLDDLLRTARTADRA